MHTFKVQRNVNSMVWEMKQNQNCSIVIRKFTAIVLMVAFSVFANMSVADAINSQEGLVLHGSTLTSLYNGKSRVVKRGDFYGYGWLDKHQVFVAFQDEDVGDAAVRAEIMDLRKSQVFELGYIKGAHGDSNFAVNSHTKEVIFNGFGEVRDSEGMRERVIKLISFSAQGNSYSIKIIKRNIACRNIYWINDNTIGALNAGDNNSVTIPIQRDK